MYNAIKKNKGLCSFTDKNLTMKEKYNTQLLTKKKDELVSAKSPSPSLKDLNSNFRETKSHDFFQTEVFFATGFLISLFLFKWLETKVDLNINVESMTDEDTKKYAGLLRTEIK